VCGCDGKTYTNDCVRQAAGTSKSYDGACGTPKTSIVCDKIGTADEGWYQDGRLLRLAKCSCVAECKNQGTVNEGYYNSCTGEIIIYAECAAQSFAGSTIEVTINDRQVQIEQNAEEGYLEISTPTLTATTYEKLRIEEGKLSIFTDAGLRDIRYLPDDVKQTLQQEYGKRLQQIKEMQLIDQQGRPVYAVKSTVKNYFLWIIPYTTTKIVSVDAMTNTLV
jgi:hypothetical protein